MASAEQTTPNIYSMDSNNDNFSQLSIDDPDERTMDDSWMEEPMDFSNYINDSSPQPASKQQSKSSPRRRALEVPDDDAGSFPYKRPKIAPDENVSPAISSDSPEMDWWTGTCISDTYCDSDKTSDPAKDRLPPSPLTPKTGNAISLDIRYKDQVRNHADERSSKLQDVPHSLKRLPKMEHQKLLRCLLHLPYRSRKRTILWVYFYFNDNHGIFIYREPFVNSKKMHAEQCMFNKRNEIRSFINQLITFNFGKLPTSRQPVTVHMGIMIKNTPCKECPKKFIFPFFELHGENDHWIISSIDIQAYRIYDHEMGNNVNDEGILSVKTHGKCKIGGLDRFKFYSFICQWVETEGKDIKHTIENTTFLKMMKELKAREFTERDIEKELKLLASRYTLTDEEIKKEKEEGQEISDSFITYSNKYVTHHCNNVK